MTISLTNITGPVYLPNGATPVGGRVSFELSSWDQEEGEALIISGPVYSTIDENGQFSVQLYTTTAGVNSVHYRMFVIWEDSELSQSYVNTTYIGTPTPHYTKKYIGSFALSGPGPFQVSDLNIISETSNSSFDAYLEMRAFVDRIDLGELDAAVALTQADTVTTSADRAAVAAYAAATDADRIAAQLAKTQAEAARDIALAGSLFRLRNFAALSRLTYDTPVGNEVFVVGGDQVEIAGVGLYVVRPLGAMDYHPIDTGANNVLLRVVPGAVGYDPLAFGAVGDGVADDTAFVQAAVDAWSEDRNSGIEISTALLISGTVLIENLETDNPETRLMITGTGTLIKNNAGFMFDKVPGQGFDPVGPDPFIPLQTGHIFFDGGIQFRGANLYDAVNDKALTFILNGENIIRVHFGACFGTGIAIAQSDTYLQSIYLGPSCVWRKWAGYLIDCDYLFDVKMLGVCEAGDAALITRDASAQPACNSLEISGLIEGLSGVSGPAVKVGVCRAVEVNNLYTEANAGGDLDFSGGDGFHLSLTITSNGFQPTAAQMADPNYYSIKLGKGAADSITVTGNTSTHNLFDVQTGNQSAVVSTGNFVPPGKNLFRPGSPRVIRTEGIDLKGTLGAAGAGWGLNMAYSSLGFEPTRETVGGESLLASITMGPTNPALGGYVQTNWVAGTFVFNTAPGVVVRQYGVGITHDAVILGWKCEVSGTPGVWREIPIMMPF